jgi:mRNA-degrading endonuclease toxin of MazEF toxin-antitoxin module
LTSPPPSRIPLRGEIWFVQLAADPPEKGRRPVVIVSIDARNRHPRADTLLVPAGRRDWLAIRLGGPRRGHHRGP